MTKICFLSPSTYPILAKSASIKIVGGAEVQQNILSKALVKKDCTVSMVCFDYGQADKCVIDGVSVIKAHKQHAGIPGLRFFHPRLTSLWKAMLKADADIYYQRCAGMETGLVAAFCTRHKRSFIYAGASNTDFMPGKQEIRFKRDRIWYEWGLKKANAIVVQNEEQMRLLKANYGLGGILIASCYDSPSIPSQTASPNRDSILWVSRTKDLKRPEIFINLARRLPNYKFMMIGGASQGKQGKAFFENISKKARRISHLEFVGFVPFHLIDSYFDRAYLFVNTSTQEGFPNTFLQAWSRGIPTISFFDTGYRLDGQSISRIVKSEEELAIAVQELTVNRKLYHDYQTRCLRYFHATHSVSSVVKSYKSLFQSLS